LRRPKTFAFEVFAIRNLSLLAKFPRTLRHRLALQRQCEPTHREVLKVGQVL
jgi:hypothetical protein